MRWTDIGARIGLDASVPLSAAFSLGIDGWLGLANRHATFNGSDVATSTPITIFNGASTISTSATRQAAFLANAELTGTYSFTPSLSVRGFVGATFDDSVPGITNPLYGGSVNAPTSRTPAAIYFKQEWSYYAGAGLRWAFNSPVVAKY